VDAENARIAFSVQLVAQILDGSVCDPHKFPIRREEAEEVFRFQVERQWLEAQNFLRIIRRFIDSSDDALNVFRPKRDAANPQRCGCDKMSNNHPIEGDLRAMIDSVFPACLALDES
jgi:hypothetical protein